MTFRKDVGLGGLGEGSSWLMLDVARFFHANSCFNNLNPINKLMIPQSSVTSKGEIPCYHDDVSGQRGRGGTVNVQAVILCRVCD